MSCRNSSDVASVHPTACVYDGNSIFALAAGDKRADVNIVGAYAAEIFAQAIVRSVKMAKSAGGVTGLGDGG